MELNNEVSIFDVEDIDLDIGELDFTLDDSIIEGSGIDLKMDSQESVKDRETIEFDYLYTITPLGLNFNVLLKEDPVVLEEVLGTFLNNLSIKGELREFFHESEIFLNHIDGKHKELMDSDIKMYEIAVDIVDKFRYNLDKLKSSLNVYRYESAPINKDTVTFRGIVDKGKGGSTIDLTKVNSYTFKNSLLAEITASNINNRKDSILHSYHDELESTLEMGSDFYEFIGYVYGITLNRNSKMKLEEVLKLERDSLIPREPSKVKMEDKLDRILTYANTSYNYTEDEIDVLKFLGFPHLICKKEEYVKPDLDGLIKDITLSMSKNDYVTRARENVQKSSRKTLAWMKKMKIYMDNLGDNNLGNLMF